MEHNTRTRFQEILSPLEDPGNEDYEACGTKALAFLNDCRFLENEFIAENKNFPPYNYCPYAVYFKLFSDGYRNWQISYNYTHIRNKFRFGYTRLVEEQERFGASSDSFPLPQEVFNHLSAMLEAYTWCENSFINNDPFALEKWANTAVRAGQEGLAILKNPTLELKDEIHKEIGEWLKEYFNKNLNLHSGLQACANLYKVLLTDRFISPEVFGEIIKVAQGHFKSLSTQSIELASELNAHILHITKHYYHVQGWNPMAKNFSGKNPTFLRVTKGKLVLAMSARCDEETARKLLDNAPILNPFKNLKDEKGKDFPANSIDRALTIFKAKLCHDFENYWGIPIKDSSFSPSVIQDIFQTSFGEALLKGLQIELGEVNVWFWDRTESQPFTFNTHAVLSALGVCTIYFSLDISANETRKNAGLSIEEIRALQSLICPHAGQTGVQVIIPDKSFRPLNCNFEYFKRIDLAGVRTDLQQIVSYLNASRDGSVNRETLEKAAGNALDSIDAILHHWLIHQETGLEEIQQPQVAMGGDQTCSQIVQTQENIQAEVTEEVGDSASLSDGLFKNIPNVRELIKDFISEDFLKEKADSLADHCDDVRYLRRLAERHLHGIETVFGEMCNPKYNTLEFQKQEFQKHLSWELRSDTGWYSYLYARSIGEFDSQQQLLRDISNFEDIKDHPDTRGLLVESREARASFDDWRFMQTEGMPVVPNLAHIRSHRTDAFFASNYHAFMFFPDDPQFLTDQYEKSIELMIRLDTALTGYSALATELEAEIVQKLRGVPSSGSPATYREYLEAIQTITLKANRIQHLIANAGVSRYKDHGDFMNAFAERMGFKKLGDLMDGQLNQLDTYSHRFYRKLQEEREGQVRDQEKKNEELERKKEKLEQRKEIAQEKRNQEQNKWLAVLTILIAAFAIPQTIEGFQSLCQQSFPCPTLWFAVGVVVLIGFLVLFILLS